MSLFSLKYIHHLDLVVFIFCDVFLSFFLFLSKFSLMRDSLDVMSGLQFCVTLKSQYLLEAVCLFPFYQLASLLGQKR